jgi:hypothetical protein
MFLLLALLVPTNLLSKPLAISSPEKTDESETTLALNEGTKEEHFRLIRQFRVFFVVWIRPLESVGKGKLSELS